MCNTACHRTVYLVGKPILTSHSFELKNLLDVALDFCLIVSNLGELLDLSAIAHKGTGWLSKEVL